MDFFKYDHSFCEALIYGSAPEYFNSFTSLFISLIGFLGLYYNYHTINDMFILYSALLINGLASCAYHWTNYIGFGLFDRCSMILIAIPCINAGIKELVYLYNLHINTNKILLFLNQVYFTFLITFCALGYEETFNGLFGVFLGLILVFIILVYKKTYHIYRIHRYISYGILGISMIFIAGVSWIIIEKLCHTVPFMRFLHGHALWHIFVSLGGYLASLLLTALSLHRKRALPIYNLNRFSITFKN